MLAGWETFRLYSANAVQGSDQRLDVSGDDWSLMDDNGQPLARIYRQSGGPQNGRWSWFVLIDAEGRPFNGGRGMVGTGREAREAVEAIVPVDAKGGPRSSPLPALHPESLCEPGQSFDRWACRLAR